MCETISYVYLLFFVVTRRLLSLSPLFLFLWEKWYKKGLVFCKCFMLRYKVSNRARYEPIKKKSVTKNSFLQEKFICWQLYFLLLPLIYVVIFGTVSFTVKLVFLSWNIAFLTHCVKLVFIFVDFCLMKA